MDQNSASTPQKPSNHRASSANPPLKKALWKQGEVFDVQDPPKVKKGLFISNEVLEQDSMMTEKFSLPKSYLSFSQMDTYAKCPKMYEYTYVMGAPRTTNLAMIQGSAVHKALETNYEQKIASRKDLPVADVLDSLSTHYDKMKEDLEDVSSEEIGAQKDLAVNFTEKYHESYAPTVQPLEVESEFSLEITPTLVVNGFIDLIQDISHKPLMQEPSLVDHVNRGKVIVDHKVGKKAKSQSDADTNLQLSIYSLVTDIPNVRYDSLIPTKKSSVLGKGIVPVLGYRTQEALDFDVTVIASIAKSISTGVFPKLGKSTWVCHQKYCSHYSKCHSEKVY